MLCLVITKILRTTYCLDFKKNIVLYMIIGELKSNKVIGNQSVYRVPNLYEKIRRDLVVVLRACFASDYTDENIRFNINPNNTKIKIYNSYPKVLEFFPCIIVSIDNVNISFKYLQDDFVQENNGIYKYNGGVEFAVKLAVYSRSVVERDRILDHLIYFLRNIIVKNIRGIGAHYSSNMSIGDESTSVINKELIFSNAISIPCYAEYEVEREVEGGVINAIDITSNIQLFMEEYND